jgi:hypothetical protein
MLSVRAVKIQNSRVKDFTLKLADTNGICGLTDTTRFKRVETSVSA